MSSNNTTSSPRPRLAPTPIARGAGWLVALTATLLIALSIGSYFYHRRQLDSIAARHLRLVVAGPGELQVGMTSTYNLLATTVTGAPWAAPVEWSLATPDGKRLMDRKETTDDQGRLTMIVPADMDLPTRSHAPAQLSVTAGGGANPPSVALPLPIRPPRYLTWLWLDRRSYQAGETVYYRSLTLSRFSLVAHRYAARRIRNRRSQVGPAAGLAQRRPHRSGRRQRLVPAARYAARRHVHVGGPRLGRGFSGGASGVRSAWPREAVSGRPRRPPRPSRPARGVCRLNSFLRGD